MAVCLTTSVSPTTMSTTDVKITVATDAISATIISNVVAPAAITYITTTTATSLALLQAMGSVVG